MHIILDIFINIYIYIFIKIYINKYVIYIYIKYYNLIIHNKCKFNDDLYWIIKNVVIYRKYP